MGVAVNAEGIKFLNELAGRLTDTGRIIIKACSRLETSYEENKALLGPHSASIQNVLEEIRNAMKETTDPIGNLSANIKDIAGAYQELIDYNGYSR